MTTYPTFPAGDSPGHAGTYPTAPTFSPGPTLTGSTGSLGTDTITTAYDLLAWPALRPGLLFDQFATIRATRQSHRGSGVQFNFVDDLELATTALDEDQDVDSVALQSATKVITMAEYGNAVTRTALIAGQSFLPVDPIAAERVGWNAGETINRLAYNALDAAAAGQTIGTGSENFDSWILREAVLKLEQANVRPFNGGNYVAVVSPTLAQQLKSESDQAGWRYVVGQNAGGGNSIYMGEVGTYEGVRIIQNNSVPDQGIGFVMGAEALAKVFSDAPGFGPNPQVVISPQVDKLRRFMSVGWKHLVGYGIFRDEAVVKLDLSGTAATKP